MAKYYLHLRDHVEEFTDPEGAEHASFEALKKAVLEAARDIMVADLRNGVIDFRFRIDAADENGKIVFTLPFQHAVNIIPH